MEENSSQKKTDKASNKRTKRAASGKTAHVSNKRLWATQQKKHTMQLTKPLGPNANSGARAIVSKGKGLEETRGQTNNRKSRQEQTINQIRQRKDE